MFLLPIGLTGQGGHLVTSQLGSIMAELARSYCDFVFSCYVASCLLLKLLMPQFLHPGKKRLCIICQGCHQACHRRHKVEPQVRTGCCGQTEVRKQQHRRGMPKGLLVVLSWQNGVGRAIVSLGNVIPEPLGGLVSFFMY